MAKDYLTFLLLGSTTLLPWNAVLVSLPYFGSLLSRSQPPLESYGLEYLQHAAPSILTTLFTTTSLISLVVANGSMKIGGLEKRAEKSLWLFVLLLASLLLTSFPQSLPTLFLLPYLVTIQILFASSSAYFQNAIMGLAGMFSSMQPAFSGQGAIGFFVSVAQFISSASTLTGKGKDVKGSDRAWGPTIFFLGCTTFGLYSMFVFKRLTKSRGWHRIMRTSIHTLETSIHQDLEDAPLLDSDNSSLASSIDSAMEASFKEAAEFHVSQWQVAKKIYGWGFAVAFIFLLTLSIFPSITVRIGSVSGIRDDIWIPLGFVVFNAGDWMGRNILEISYLDLKSKKKLIWASISRIIFIPLFLLCNVRRMGEETNPVINSDIIYLLLLLAFSLSNGYISTTVMVHALEDPSLLPVEISSASTSMVLFLYIGIAAGSFSSFGVRAVI